MTSPAAKGTRLAHSIASSFDFTWIIQNPAISSFSGNGPSVTEGAPRENLTRAPFELGWIPSPASRTPAFTISSLNRSIAATSSLLGRTPASVFLSARTSIMNRIVSPCGHCLVGRPEHCRVRRAVLRRQPPATVGDERGEEPHHQRDQGGRFPPGTVLSAPRRRYFGGPSRTGPTSAVLVPANGDRAALAMASSRSLTSMSM